jgi:hypothetical protein
MTYGKLSKATPMSLTDEALLHGWSLRSLALVRHHPSHYYEKKFYDHKVTFFVSRDDAKRTKVSLTCNTKCYCTTVRIFSSLPFSFEGVDQIAELARCLTAAAPGGNHTCSTLTVSPATVYGVVDWNFYFDRETFWEAVLRPHKIAIRVAK